MVRLGAVLDQRLLSDKIYQLLREKIIRAEFVGGERLDVAELAEELDVSRTSVKAAIDRLAIEGLVTIAPRHGTFVARLQADEIADIYGARLMIELFAVERGLPGIAETELAHLRVLESRMREIAERDAPSDAEMEEIFALDSQFHVSLVGLARNKRIDAMYAGLDLFVQLMRAYHARVPWDPSGSVVEHRAILEACERRDLTAARCALRHHIESARQMAVEKLAGREAVAGRAGGPSTVNRGVPLPDGRGSDPDPGRTAEGGAAHR